MTEISVHSYKTYKKSAYVTKPSKLTDLDEKRVVKGVTFYIMYQLNASLQLDNEEVSNVHTDSRAHIQVL